MKKHKYTIGITTDSKKEAEKKIKALVVLAQHLSEETLTALAKVVKQDPEKVEFAKHYLGIT